MHHLRQHTRESLRRTSNANYFSILPCSVEFSFDPSRWSMDGEESLEHVVVCDDRWPIDDRSNSSHLHSKDKDGHGESTDGRCAQSLTRWDWIPVFCIVTEFTLLDQLEQFLLISIRCFERRITAKEYVKNDTSCPTIDFDSIALNRIRKIREWTYSKDRPVSARISGAT